MTELLLFGLIWLPSSASAFSHFYKLILWLKFFYRQKAGGGHGGKDYRVLLCFIFPYVSGIQSNVNFLLTWKTVHRKQIFFSPAHLLFTTSVYVLKILEWATVTLSLFIFN